MARRAPFPLHAQLPAELQGVILDFHWDLKRLHALDLPQHDVPTRDLLWHLDLPFWATPAGPFTATPAEVRASPDQHAQQWYRTMAADLHYPLDAYVSAAGRLTILDGIHRLLKAAHEDLSVVPVRTLHPDEFDAIAVPAPA